MYNIWAIIASAVASLVIGTLWYGPLFQKPWMRMTGLTIDSMRAMAMTPMQATVGGFVSALLTAFVFSWLADALLLVGVRDALQMAFWCWLGFAVPISASGWLWEGRPFKLSALYAGYYAVFYAVASLIVTLWK
jgi:hypothetical protein